MIDAIIFPTDNTYGIPALLPEYQAAHLIAPVTTWGSLARSATMPGTWHFYTDDYRFNALLKRPDQLIKTAAVAAIEPNITIPPGLPLALALARIYQKRWIARTWQNAGIAIWVDLNVSAEFAAANLLGVPRGWLAYATRGYTANLDQIEQEFILAQQHAGQRPNFLVYGGGAAVQSAALANGWHWLPERANVVRGAQ